MKRLLVALVVVLLTVAVGVAVVAAQGGSDDDPTASTPSPTATGGAGADLPPSADLARFYSQDLEWTSCDDGAECATLEVPLDYSDPDGATIDLALLRVPAADPERP